MPELDASVLVLDVSAAVAQAWAGDHYLRFMPSPARVTPAWRP